MRSFDESMKEYKKQQEKGTIRDAYRGLMEYIQGLKTYFQKKHPEHDVSGGLYFGFMDMTYFSIVPPSLKQRRLKIAVVFLHETCRFEVWLAGVNKQVQQEYWQRFKESGWKKYRLVPTIKGADSILEAVLAESPDFNDLDSLTKQIEAGTVKFIKDVEGFLAKQ